MAPNTITQNFCGCIFSPFVRLWEEGWKERYYLHKFAVSKELDPDYFLKFRKRVVSFDFDVLLLSSVVLPSENLMWMFSLSIIDYDRTTSYFDIGVHGARNLRIMTLLISMCHSDKLYVFTQYWIANQLYIALLEYGGLITQNDRVQNFVINLYYNIGRYFCNSLRMSTIC